MAPSEHPLLRRIAGAVPALGIALCGLWADPAIAAPPQISVPTEEQLQPGVLGAPGGGLTGFLTGVTRSNYLLGGMWGLRSFLSHYGISFALEETSEVLGNVSGGARQGFDYDGLTQLLVQMDTQRAFGWHGGTVNASALQYHGRSLSADNLATLQTASGIEADRATRLWELWYQQKFLEEDRLDVKIGQQSLDQEFIVSQNALLFVNTMFGWPMVPSADLPGGGPAYPLSALGVRVRARPDRFADFPRGRVQRQPGGEQHRRSAAAKSVGHQLPAERRRARDRRAAIHLPFARHHALRRRVRAHGARL